MNASEATFAELKNLSAIFGNQSKVSILLDVDKSRMTRWLHKHDRPDSENAERIASLWHIFLRLTRIYEPETAFKWLTGANAYLGDRKPADLIREGRVAEVLGAIEQAETGSYA